MNKDANDLLRELIAEGIAPEEQIQRVRGLLDAATPVVEVVARWAGAEQGAKRDEALRTAFGLIQLMDKQTRALYRSRLCEWLGIGIREFNEVMKAIGEKGKGESEEIRETLGGWFPTGVQNNGTGKIGWLLEYLYDLQTGEARLAYRDPEGKVGTAGEVSIEGIKYVPKTPNEFIKDEGVMFASELGQLKDTRELVAMVEAFINEHYLLESHYLSRIIAYYVMLTWVYDAFNALPYLRAIGEAGAGKSELMRRVGHLCYRLMSASGANTAASFFRATEMYRGTVFIDEADLYDGGDMSNEIVKFLNQGAMKGNKIWRLEEKTFEGVRDFEVRTFQTFCPKLIAMRREFRDDAVSSRSLTIKLMPREPIELKSRGIQLYIDDRFRERARKLRNLLLRWRLESWRPEIAVGEEFMDLQISSRLNQVTMPIKALAGDDQALLKEIEQFLREYNRELVISRSMTIAARCVEALWKIYKYPDLRVQYLDQDVEGEFMMIGDVRKVANEIMDEMNRGDEEEEGEGSGEGDEKPRYRKRKRDELSARGVGSIVRNELQLRVGGRKKFGYPVYWDAVKMEALARRYGVEFEAILPEPAEEKKAPPRQEEMEL